MIRHFFLKILKKHTSHWIVLFIDNILVCLSFILAYSIRFNASFNFDVEKLPLQLLFISIFASVIFWLVGSNRGIIRHSSTKDAFNILVAVTILSLTLLITVTLNHTFNILPLFTIPKTIVFIHYFITVFLLIVSRFIFKGIYDIISNEIEETTNILIYGAGDSGLITYSAINRAKEKNYEIVGFIDDDKSKIGRKIDRKKIYSRKQIDKEFVERNNIKEIIFSIQNIKSERLLYLTDKAIGVGLQPKIVPPFSKWIDGGLEANQIKKVKIEDLLNRKPISINNPIVKKEVNNKVILVTGAAGSIGSEISRQLSTYNLNKLILVDQAESALYNLQQELKRRGNNNFIAIVADITDRERIDQIFKEHKPEKVFHAAAYKHVPLMEENPYEAIKINIGGTKNIADLSIKHKIERFVMVSTDKAVNPTNVMGATKRVAEIYIQSLINNNLDTKFTTTRFGNVLGSNGSVIPLFKKQIEEGGPLTVTHEEITRYFMTIPEACQLVLEAGTMGQGGEIYIFDMGKSVKIFDIAKRMIHLSGLNYPEDINIKITGLRPGEKLYEELLADGENTIETYHNKIMIAKTQFVDKLLAKQEIETLLKENKPDQIFDSVKLIKKIVPEYKSMNSDFKKLD